MKRFIRKISSYVSKTVCYCAFMQRPFYRYYRKKYKSFYRRFSPFTSLSTPGIRQCDRRTVVDIERKFLFNRIAKVASSTFMATLSPNPEDKKKYKKKHRRPWQVKKKHLKELDGLFKFIFVRNPYNRILSAYLEKMGLSDKKRKRCKRKFPWIFKKYGEKPSFSDFCLYLQAGGLYEDKHWAPQVSLMALPVEEFDFIGKIENIREDFKTVTSHVNSLKGREIKRTGPHTGASDKIQKYYNEKTIDIVSRLYREDFENFGYEYIV